ncbi:hypothetical protein [Jiangella endophytica]|uniref:hypothetical protein n=1 Tax=Jiangella endophytica TaxID=1623398 RepID=UPI0013007A7B|nr:hypothetical protein [Jiangella endophytica]
MIIDVDAMTCTDSIFTTSARFGLTSSDPDGFRGSPDAAVRLLRLFVTVRHFHGTMIMFGAICRKCPHLESGNPPPATAEELTL